MVMPRILPDHIYTKVVQKTPEEVYSSLEELGFLSEEGKKNRDAVILEIERLLMTIDQPSIITGPTPFNKAESEFVNSKYIKKDSRSVNINRPKLLPQKIEQSDLPSNYSITEKFSQHVVKVDIMGSSDPDAIREYSIVKRIPDEFKHEPKILIYLYERWSGQFDDLSIPPFPRFVKPLGENLFQEEFINERLIQPHGIAEKWSQIYFRIEPLLYAIEWIHEQGVIHRDINPKNIFISNSTARLIDFGSAYCPKIQEQIIPFGTPCYYPPEMFETSPNPKIDIFSLAITLYHFFFDFLPYDENFRKNSPINKTFLISLKEVLDIGTSLNPNDRYENIAVFRDAIRKALNISG